MRGIVYVEEVGISLFAILVIIRDVGVLILQLPASRKLSFWH